MSENEAEIERRVRERQRIDKVEAQAEKNSESVALLRRDTDDKIERLAHRMVEDLMLRLEDKNTLFETKMLSRIDERLAAFGARVVMLEHLPDAVRKEHAHIETDKQSESRSTARFWLGVMLGGISIGSAAFTVIFWFVQMAKG